MSKEMKFHELSEVFPLMRDEEIKALADDIKQNGLLEEIMVYKGKILDGRNRYRACLQAGVKPRFENVPEDADIKRLVASLNLNRRHLNESQRAMIAADLWAEIGDGNGDEGKIFPTALEAANAVNVSDRSVKAAKKVRDKGSKSLQKAVRSGAVRVSAAVRVAKLPKSQQDKIVKRGPKAVKAVASSERKAASEKRVARGGIYAEMQAVRAKALAAPVITVEISLLKAVLVKLVKKRFAKWKTAKQATSEIIEALEAL